MSEGMSGKLTYQITVTIRRSDDWDREFKIVAEDIPASSAERQDYSMETVVSAFRHFFDGDPAEGAKA
jgi:hypothetical protein